MHDPEPRTEKPDDGRYITADCGHEVYEGDESEIYEYFEYEKLDVAVFRQVAKTMCRSCAEDMQENQSFGEWCCMMNITSRKVFDDDRG
jgi:hypothetical protein